MCRLLDAEGQGPEVAEACAELVEAWERELNALVVYELYGLTEEKIAVVGEETEISRINGSGALGNGRKSRTPFR